MKRKIAIALALLLILAAVPCLGEATDPFCGRWQDPVYGRAVLEISSAGGDGYDIQIIWGNSADSDGVWHMSARREGDSLVYADGSMAVVTYGEEGVTEEVCYDDAEGAFTLTSEGKLLWSDTREDRAPEFAFEKLWPTEGQLTFASLTGLDEARQRLEGGATITSVYYTDGFQGPSEFTTEDPEEIETLWEALNMIEVAGETDEDVTDWYPLIVFHFSDDTSFSVRFDGPWLEVGGANHYALSNADEFWGLTAYLVSTYNGLEG